MAEVIRYVLFKTHQTGGCPIKREELTQIVTKNYCQRALPGLVINEAAAKLASIFGYEMRELQRSRPSSANQGRSSQQSERIQLTVILSISVCFSVLAFDYIYMLFVPGSADAKSYVLMSKLPADVYRKFVEGDNAAHLTGFAFVVISIVHLSGGKIAEGK